MRSVRVVSDRLARRLAVVSLGSVLLSAAAVARAAAQAAVTPGDWVRVRAAGHEWRLDGRVLDADSAGFTILPATARHPITVRYADVRTLDVRLSRESAAEGAVHGLGVGLLAGFATGTAFTVGVVASGADRKCDDCFISPTAAAAVLGGMFTVGAGVVGAGIGAYNPRQHWRRVLPPPRVSLTPIVPAGARHGGGAGLALSVRF